MKITKISIWNINLKSHETYYMAGNKTCDEVESVIISIDTDSGIQGWSECCPIPHYLPAYAKGIVPALTELAPIIIGSDPVGPEALMLKVNKYLQGHNYAKSPLDFALWDITANFILENNNEELNKVFVDYNDDKLMVSQGFGN